MLGEPKYYELISNVAILKEMFYPTIFADSYLIMYKPSDLTDPAITPICQYYYSGIKRFILDDEEYSSMDIDINQLNMTALRLYNDGAISAEHYNSIKSWMGHNSEITNTTLMSAI